MAKIQINNPRQIINGGAKKYYFKVKGLGGPKGDKGDKGDTGATGPQGPQGNASTVSVGSTTTLPVGYDATVTNTGSIYNAVLNFGIPQGPQGPQGAKGDKGDTGAQGETGPRGPQGERGTNATVYVGTTTTTNPGTQARVYNSGTDSNAVLNFEIPRGDVGPSVPLVQETGYSTTKAMSQNATTEALNGKQNTLTAGSNIQISGSTISATDTKYSAGNGITLTGTQFSANTSVLATKNDLSSYYTKTQIDSQMAAKQDDLVAGSNIQIAPDGKTISATDTTYTAGTGLTLTGTEFSADTTVLATQTDLTTALAPKLEAEVVAELPTTGEEGKLYLTPKAHTTQTATGNPITATVAEEAGAIESFQLDGDTFQQSYTGKNLWSATTLVNGYYKFADGVLATGNTNYVTSTEKIDVTAGESYHISADKGIGVAGSGCVFFNNDTFVSSSINPSGSNFTVPEGANKMTFNFFNSAGLSPSEVTHIQLEKGSTATAYEPYVGGVPSPNPSYPQQIQTVTGEQTVSINGANYLIDLGSIELCKLGTYQDYIYKSGDKWYVHKEVGKAIYSSSDFTLANNDQYTNVRYAQFTKQEDNIQYGNYDHGTIINYFTAARNMGGMPSGGWDSSNAEGEVYNNATRTAWWCSFTKTTSLDTIKSKLDGMTAYYVLATSTDTTITDQTLIAQLEAIRTASLQNGTNTITNTATGSNLAGDMEIGYYGYDPRNRYDKWLWLDINNEYEQIGS